MKTKFTAQIALVKHGEQVTDAQARCTITITPSTVNVQMPADSNPADVSALVDIASRYAAHNVKTPDQLKYMAELCATTPVPEGSAYRSYEAVNIAVDAL